MKSLVFFAASLLLFLGACENSDVTLNNSEKKSDLVLNDSKKKDEQVGVLVSSPTNLPLNKLQENPNRDDRDYITWYVTHQEEFIKAANYYYGLLKYIQLTEDDSPGFVEDIRKAKVEYGELGEIAMIDQLNSYYRKTQNNELKLSYEYYNAAIMEVARATDLEYRVYINGGYLEGEKLQIEEHLKNAQSFFDEAYEIVEKYLKYEKWTEETIAEEEPKGKENSNAEQKNKDTGNSNSNLSLDEMRKMAKDFVDEWNGYDNQLLDEYDSEDVRVYEFKDGPTEHLIAVTVNYKTGEVNPDQGMN